MVNLLLPHLDGFITEMDKIASTEKEANLKKLLGAAAISAGLLKSPTVMSRSAKPATQLVSQKMRSGVPFMVGGGGSNARTLHQYRIK